MYLIPFQEGPCKYDSRLGVAKVNGFYFDHFGVESKLAHLVGDKGPAAVAVDVESDFLMYRGGIYAS
ncbi:Cathepsin L4 [Fasciola hepatica]|uniref:Cathepsin L4 n=1 Tax=Fasciola hepatica TaxID=6192 RepID=A0A4E0QT42_FASHE|nr:Cathepsin L4 [Fasciola hepatica]